MKFIGRIKQLEQLKKEMTSDEMRMSLIYGRRRVGKSELVKQAIKESGIKSFYYECKQVTEASNVQSICEVLSEVQNLPKLGYTSLDELLDYVFSLAKEENIVLVLDEYPYLRENVKDLDSILQSLVDKYREISKLKLIHVLEIKEGEMETTMLHFAPAVFLPPAGIRPIIKASNETGKSPQGS